MASVPKPEQVIETLGTFLKEKFHEHYHAQIKVELGLPSGTNAKDGILFLCPWEAAENLDKAGAEKTRYSETLKSGEVVEYQKNPILYFNLKILLAFESHAYFQNTILLMQLYQIIKEYVRFKVENEDFDIRVLPGPPMGELINFWKNLELKFRPSLVCRLGLGMEPIRVWKYKKVQERIVKTQIAE